MIQIYTYVCLYISGYMYRYVCIFFHLISEGTKKNMDKSPNYYNCYIGWVGRVMWTLNYSIMYFHFVSSFCENVLLLQLEKNI